MTRAGRVEPERIERRRAAVARYQERLVERYIAELRAKRNGLAT